MLEDMIKMYLAPGDAPDWKCSACDKRGCVQELQILKWPRVLCVMLKRFRHVPMLGIVKTSNRVWFPEILEELDNRPRYRLRSVCIHDGFDLMSGHYTCCVRTEEGWFHCDDHKRPDKVNLETNVLIREPYILFYERLD